MTYQEAADYLGIQVTTLANLVASGKVQRIKEGPRRVRFEAAELDRYAASRNDPEARSFIRGEPLTERVLVRFSASEMAELSAVVTSSCSMSRWCAEKIMDAVRLTSRK